MELRTERKLSQKALAEQLQLAGYEFSDLTVLRIEKGQDSSRIMKWWLWQSSSMYPANTS